MGMNRTPLVRHVPRADAAGAARVTPCAVGVADAIEPIFVAEWAHLVGVARLLLDEPRDAEEVVQEAFVRLFTAWASLREPTAAPAWLRTTVMNLARQRLRRRLVVRRTRGLDHPWVEDPETATLRDTAAAEVVAALTTLPRRQRECVVLRYWSQLSLAEIASTLGVSVGTVKTHLHRATTELEKRLEEHHA